MTMIASFDLATNAFTHHTPEPTPLRLAPDPRCQDCRPHVGLVCYHHEVLARQARAAAPEPTTACCPQCFVPLEMGDGTCDCTPLLEPQSPPPSPAPAAACPEALFSATLKGLSGGLDALYTARGQTWEEFELNLARVRGLFDVPLAPPASSPAAPGAARPAVAREEWCSVHQAAMTWHDGSPRGWYSHKADDDARYNSSKGYCKGTLPKARR